MYKYLKHIALIISTSTIVLMWGSGIKAQCSFSCAQSINMSVGKNCERWLYADDITKGNGVDGTIPSCPKVRIQKIVNITKKITLLDKFVDSFKLTSVFIGDTLEVSVSDSFQAPCWSYVIVEDKISPNVICGNLDTLSCNNTKYLNKTNIDLANIIRTILQSRTGGLVDNCTPSSLITVKVNNQRLLDEECISTVFTSRQVISYAVSDLSQGVTYCNDTVYYKTFHLDSIASPSKYILDCELSPKLSPDSLNFNPGVAINSQPVPTLKGLPVVSYFQGKLSGVLGVCELSLDYEDSKLPICGGGYKIIRKWTVLNWCESQSNTRDRRIYQTIKIGDDSLKLAKLDTVIGSLSAYECLGSVYLPRPKFNTSCSNKKYSVEYYHVGKKPVLPPPAYYWKRVENANVKDSFSLDTLHKGYTAIKYTGIDECENIDTTIFFVKMIDKTAPYAACDQLVEATISSGKPGRVPAISFDNGSFDNCGDSLRFEVQRMGENKFWPYLEFACEDVNNTIMVRLKIATSVDSSYCMSSLIVSDKTEPVLVCPPNLTINCDDTVNYSGLKPPTISDNCNKFRIEKSELFVRRDQCGPVSYYVNWNIFRNNETAVYRTCQTVIFVNRVSKFSAKLIQWPRDTIVNDCNSLKPHPDQTGKPTWDEATCSFVNYSYSDDVKNDGQDACRRIYRKFSVIDWCSYNENTGAGYWSYTQIIRILDPIGPTFDGGVACVSYSLFANEDRCDYKLIFETNATDNCTLKDDLSYSYVIDVLSDEDKSNDIKGSSRLDTIEYMPLGNHTITYYVTDQCGNTEKCTTLIKILDQKAPTPYCRGGISTALMKNNGTVAIWASDFDLGGTDCSGKVDVTISPLNSNLRSKSLTFTCRDTGINQVKIWFSDPSGNSDYCIASILIRDNDGFCTDNSGGTSASEFDIAGNVTTQNARIIENADINLTDYNTKKKMSSKKSSNQGKFEFNSMPMGNSYQLEADKNDNILNGLSSLDMLLIQKHLLNILHFPSAYQVIAADVNEDGTVNISDVLEIRKVILGINSQFESGRVWKFVDGEQVFADKLAPWPVRDKIDLKNLSSHKKTNKFIGLKLGDVDNTVKLTGLTSGRTTQNVQSRSIETQDKIVRKNMITKVPIYLRHIDKIAGFQLKVENIDQNFNILNIENGSLDIKEDMWYRQGRFYTMSWMDVQGKQIDANQPLFYLVLESKEDKMLSEGLRIDENFVNEVYDENLMTYKLQLQYNEYNSVNEVLGQNVPNPFISETSIPITLQEASLVELTIRNIEGKVLWKKSYNMNEGKNNIVLNRNEIQGADDGVLIYSIAVGGKVSTKRMILINK